MDHNATAAADKAVAEFLKTVTHKTRAADTQTLLEVFGRLTGWRAQMWGPTIIGYGRYAYKYESGREGTSLVTGFSPRKASLSIYIMPGYQDLSAPLSRLGKHKIGKACLYINKLADIDQPVLEEIILQGVAHMKAHYDVTAH